MKRASIRVQEPTPELIEKIRRARVAISQQKPRYLKCPYCQHNAIAVYEDTRGHVESKCKKCGRIKVQIKLLCGQRDGTRIGDRTDNDAAVAGGCA